MKRLLFATALVLIASYAFATKGSQAATITRTCANTAADTAAIQSAFNSLQSGDTLVLTNMCGVGSAGLKLTGKSNVVVKGRGRGTGFRALATPATNGGMGEFGWGPMMIDVTNCVGCTFRDMDFDLNHKQTGAVIFHNATNLLYENNYHRWGTVAQTFSGLNVHPATMVGVKGIQGADKQPSVGNNTFRHNVFELSCCPGRTVQRGLFIAHASGALVENNIFRKLSHTALAPLNAPGFNILNNSFQNNRYGGLKASTLDNYRELTGSGTKTIVSGNTMDRISADGINLDNMSNVEVRNNKIGHTNNAVAFTGSAASNVLIEQNMFCDDGFGPPIHYEATVTVRKNIVVRNNQTFDTCAAGSLAPPAGAGNVPVN